MKRRILLSIAIVVSVLCAVCYSIFFMFPYEELAALIG